jgi:hypothetical protein
MKIFYKNQCLNLISASRPNFCEGCYFDCWPNCYAPLTLVRLCAVTNKKFKLELKKDISEL